MNTRLSDSEVRGLNPPRGLWYFAILSKRPFKIPIPSTVARALIRQPDLVLADEPTGNLDTQTGDELFGLLRKLNKTHGTAFIIVTHNEKLSHQTDRLIHLQDGQILEDRCLKETSRSLEFE
jgi:ABC-type multidrug transport system ATPase subunit